jgi:3-deoxy-manno-octulosonate cytidylyltransferase (CMP-KDO synthetase)
MVLHVYFRARLCKTLDAVYVTTPDPAIRDVVESYGAPVIMTSPNHERCTDRVAEAAAAIHEAADVVVNIQGDEPMLYPELVNGGVRMLAEDPAVVCAHPLAPIEDGETFRNRNVIKVVTDQQGAVLFMSREPIPTTVRLGESGIQKRQLVVVLSFRRDFLQTYTCLAQTPLEQAESVDILRILEHGYKIHTFAVDRPTISVDVPNDVRRVEQALTDDPLVPQYLEAAKSRWQA